MDFNHTEERVMLRDTLQRFLGDSYTHDHRRAVIASGRAYDETVFSALAEQGVLGALFTEEQGGFGGRGFDLSVVFEELGRAGVIEPLLPALLSGSILAGMGRDELVAEIITGEQIIALAHGETDARYDLNHVSTTAQAQGDERVLTGTKTNVLFGAQAGHLIVSARESGDVRDEAGISLFLVPIDAEGLTVVDHPNLDGTSGATVTLQQVRLDPAARLGQAGAGFEVIEAAVARALTALSAEALGAMEAVRDLTVAYLKERKQFGVPIGKFQALQLRMADMLIEIEQVRSGVILAAGHLGGPRHERERHVSASNNLVGRVAALVAEECIQMHGGIGMTDEYALSHYARRLTMIDHQFGDVDHHLMRFTAFGAE
ncbi:acyl-CoA dehydrogenase family protein [Ruegeria sp. HU-ET01832]|uniref:acyl-CoA dehydrogenase family protein n=1 Tax=Ruegeria sp. HU-ET01832 TaxID=3135906 RepID=UPI0031039187